MFGPPRRRAPHTPPTSNSSLRFGEPCQRSLGSTATVVHLRSRPRSSLPVVTAGDSPLATPREKLEATFAPSRWSGPTCSRARSAGVAPGLIWPALMLVVLQTSLVLTWVIEETATLIEKARERQEYRLEVSCLPVFSVTRARPLIICCSQMFVRAGLCSPKRYHLRTEATG